MSLPPPDAVPPKLPVNQEEEEVLKELCSSNGLNFSRLGQEGPSCVHLESFFSGIPRIIGMTNFPNLQILCIMGQPQLYKIEGINCCTKLKELWISECQLQSMTGLEGMKNLRKLYLYSNVIRKIECTEHLSQLEVLWLSDNKISVMEGLSCLSYLRDLNLAENEIDTIGNSLNGLERLEKLELSGNPIYSFKDLTNLSRLHGLKELGLKSPNYRSSAVGQLCNYATHIMYHLPLIYCLDTYDISSKVIKELAETTVVKKKMFYNMRVKTERRNLAKLQNNLNHIKLELHALPSDRLRMLHKCIKEIEREVKELQDEDDGDARESGTESDKDAREAKNEEDKSTVQQFRSKVKSLKERCKKWEKKMTEIEHFCSECCERLQHSTFAKEKRMLTELETGGNVRFEDGKPTDVWFSSCHELVLSRFCASDYRDLNITGIKVHKITRVHNRILRTRFDDTLDLYIEEEESLYIQQPNTRSTTYKKHIEYLFWVWDPEMPGGLTEPHRVLEEGFMDADTYKQMGKDNAVPFTNSLFVADKLRLQHAKKQSRSKEHADSCPARHGQLIVAKVYTGKSAVCNDHSKIIDRNNWPKPDSVYRPRKDRPVSKSDNALGAEVGSKSQCECSHRQCEWFIFDKNLTMPEYIIDFEYTTRFKPKSPFAVLTEGLLERKDYKQLCQPEELPADDDVIAMAPVTKPRVRLVTITEELLLKTAKQQNMSSITVLNLHDNGLTKLKLIHSLPALKKLIVSFNELTKLDDLSHLNIDYLDASFNKITSLEGFKSLTKLKHLDLSWNRLQNTRDDISILRKHAPVLASLNVTHNTWQKQEGLRLRAIGRIKSLTSLNDDPVTETEATAALRMAAGSRVSQVSLLAQSRTDTAHPKTLYLESMAHILLHHSRNKPDRITDQDNLWYSKVTTLNLDSQHISKLSNLDRLENLRWASMNNNDITKMEGLDSCHNLEELSLENNCISKLEGISKLTKLKRLCLGHNYLHTLDGAGLDRLVSLQYLSVESNKIVGLFGVQKACALVELYMANNLVENLREVFYLKNLSLLVIVDLYGNPVVASSDNYRLFVIYHLKSLRALDGVTIELSEGGLAKDAFGGRLTQDFVAERMGHANFSEVRELDFPNANIRTVDIGNGEQFTNLRSVNLEHNNMTSLSGLVHLLNLRVLCLNHNHIESLLPRPKALTAASLAGAGRGKPNLPAQSYNLVSGDAVMTPVLESLEVLHLGYNNIKDMSTLQLSRLPSLKALFLQGNEISKVEGLDGLHDLRELVLDRNKIKTLNDFSFVNQWNLQELHMEENRIKDLNNFQSLENLQRLFLGSNRVQDMVELEKLGSLGRLLELSVANNAVARRMLHRPMLVYRMPQLVVIDGIPVTEDERNKADLYFMEQQPPAMTTTIETTLPGIGQYKTQIPVKVTNMQLVSGPYYDKTWGGTIHFSEEAIQDVQRGAGRRRTSNRVEATLTGNAKPTLSYHQQPTPGAQPTMSYSGGSRSQHQVSQVPYVPQGHSSDQNDLYSRTNRNNRR